MKKIDLINELHKIGLEKNMKILLHVSLSKIGYLNNGPKDLIDAIEDIITTDGILVMPAYNSYGNYKPTLSIVNEYFRNQEDVTCTNQIIASFAVWGKQKEKIAANKFCFEKKVSKLSNENYQRLVEAVVKLIENK